MSIPKIFVGVLLAACIFAGAPRSPARAATSPAVDNHIWAELLEKYVHAGKVNYEGFKAAEARLDGYLEILEAVDAGALSRDEQFAFYINAYNAWTIKMILTKYPDIKSIRELGFFNTGPWKKKIVRLKEGAVSLDHIEHDILRPRFKDPRVHFAINCASISCPALRREPYRGETLNRQLDDATRSFLNNPDSYRFDGDTFYVSKIFEWFAVDFDSDPIGFYLKYADEDLKKRLEKNRNSVKIKYLEYDWGLNGE